jgi:hypothetical protein
MPQIITTKQLEALCSRALKLNFANGPNDKFWEDVAGKGKHFVETAFLHRPYLPFWAGVKHPFNFGHNGGVNIRAILLCQMKNGKRAVLICDFDEAQFISMGLTAKNSLTEGMGSSSHRKRQTA